MRAGSLAPIVCQGLASRQRSIQRERLPAVGRSQRSTISRTTHFHLGGRRNVAPLGGQRVTLILAVSNDSARSLGDGIHPPYSVEHRAGDEAARILRELRTAEGIEGIDGTDQADAPIADEIVEIEARNKSLEPACELAHERQQRSYRRIASRRVDHGALSKRDARSAANPRSSRAAISRARRSSS